MYVGGYFQGEGKKKYCCVRRKEGGHYKKNKNIGGCFVNAQELEVLA